ncbi:unnamed protein product [Psylliodes chrysocephalus]|uniref:ADP/ATP translocase n=1 Tax=Psylliodes chrysocephalus TaxID=3402493 RepID=A0A9P0CK41_9CUCU|nr:unnamed protein product [Psylliodes chrysocephala]
MPTPRKKPKPLSGIPLTERLSKDFLIAGSSSALIMVTVAPIARVKLLLQLQATHTHIPKERLYKGIIDACLRIPKEDGVLGFWRGNTANTIRSFFNAAFNFTFKNVYHDMFVTGVDKNSSFFRYFVANLAAGGAAGATATCLLYPLDYLATRMASDITEGRQYHGLADCFLKTLHSDGPQGLYRGFFTSINGIIIYRSVYFGLYDTAKEKIPQNSFWAAFFTAQIATSAAAMLAYPFDTVRRRMMMQSCRLESNIMYFSSMHCWIKIARTEGPMAFYKGAFCNTLLSTGAALLLVVYDRVRVLL